MDWRPIDRVEDSPFALGINFRESTPYQAMGAGNRRIRVFPTSTNPDITSKFLIDTTITFEANVYYTLIHAGFARPGSTPEDRIVVLRDELQQAPPGNQFAIRAINAGASVTGGIDVFASTSSTTFPTTPTFSGLTFPAASNYVTRDTGTLVLRASGGGLTTAVTATAPAGDTATTVLSAVPGSRIGGSVLTAIAVPRSVAGSAAPQTTAFTSPALVYLLDRRPGATCGRS